MIYKIFKNKVISFVLLKYLAFAIQLINSILIAKHLGVYYFGIYGFALMILQYLSYSNLGVQYSFSVMYSDSLNSPANRKNIASSAMSILIITSLIVFLGYILTYKLELFPKFIFSEYYLFIILITIGQHFNVFFTNLFRMFGKIGEINIYYLLIPSFQLIAILLFKGHELFIYLFYFTIMPHIICGVLFAIRFPSELRGIKLFNFSMAFDLVKRGVFLLFYTFSFYGIVLSAKTLVGYYFSVEEFGLFNFAVSLSNSVFLLLGSLSFLFTPKLINVISSKNGSDINHFIDRIRKYYLTLTICIVFLSLGCLPIIFYFLPQYSEVSTCFQILLLGQLLINNSFGYTTFLVQRSKELRMSFISLISICIVIILSVTSFFLFKDLLIVSASVVVSALSYNVLITYIAKRELQEQLSFYKLFQELFPISLFAPVCIYILCLIISPYYFINVLLSFISYVWMNFYDLRSIIKGGKKIILSNNSLIVN